MASQFASQYHQVHYLQIISSYIQFHRQDIILLCICICLSDIPYASHCRLDSLFHLFNSMDQNRALMLCYFNQVNKSQQKKYSELWIFFWTVLWEIHGLTFKCFLTLRQHQLQISFSTRQQQNPVIGCLFFAISFFTILKLSGMHNHCHHHPVHAWTQKTVRCTFWR